MKLILCVEDEIKVLENNRKALIDSGYKVLTAKNLKEARGVLAESKPDGIVLDIMLPDGLGLDLLKELRGQGNKVPVLLLTAWDKPSDIVRGLSAGANDYLSKPFDYGVLLARLDAMFRNVSQLTETLRVGNMTLDIIAGRALVDGIDLTLTKQEFSLLLALAQSEGKTISAEELYQKAWGQPMLGEKRALQRRMSDLKTKLSDCKCNYAVNTVYGTGYCFEKTKS